MTQMLEEPSRETHSITDHHASDEGDCLQMCARACRALAEQCAGHRIAYLKQPAPIPVLWLQDPIWLCN